MTTTIRLSFPAGRYHGTPWGRHVNEGVPEWPPSPYRLLRALYDVWQRKCFHLPANDVRDLLQALGSFPPSFKLPTAVATHTRSYLSANGYDPNDKNLVFDSFLVFNRPHACYISWADLELTDGNRATLGTLLENLNYLGRSESWVQAELWTGPTEGVPCEVITDATAGGELTSVACAVPPSQYSAKTPWIDALTFSTANLLKQRASSPPLLQSVKYVRPDGAILTDPPHRSSPRRPNVQAVLLALDCTVLPLVTTSLEVAEQVRVRLMGAHKRRQGNDKSKVSSLFSGKDSEGAKRLDNGHVYILPLGNDRGRIDRILILSPLRAFTPDELDAVRGVRELYQRDDRPEVRCVVTWQGDLTAAGIRTPSTTAVSSTPFVPARHWRKGRDFQKFIEDEVRRECINHRIGAEPTSVEITSKMDSLFDLVEYRRNRKDDPVRPGFALRLAFAQPVLAPFTIGYAAHFGLGQFRPEP